MGVRLHTFVLVRELRADELESTELDGYLTAARRYASEHGPSRRAVLQSGLAAIAAVVTINASDEALAWARRPHGHRFGAVAYPVLVDLARNEVVHPGRMIVGGIFSPFLRRLVADVLTPPQ